MAKGDERGERNSSQATTLQSLDACKGVFEGTILPSPQLHLTFSQTSPCLKCGHRACHTAGAPECEVNGNRSTRMRSDTLAPPTPGPGCGHTCFQGLKLGIKSWLAL